MATRSLGSMVTTAPDVDPDLGHIDHLDAAFRSPAKENTKRLTLDVTPELHRWLLSQRLTRDVTAAALLRALAHLAATDPKLLDRAVAQAETDAAS